MKKVSRTLLFILSALMINGCSGRTGSLSDEKPETKEANSETKAVSKNTPKGITVNKIKFEKVNDNEIPEILKNSINSLKANRGYIYLRKDGYYYIAILSGKKNTGGHSINVVFVEDNEGKTNIAVEEKSPKPEDIVTQVITYPYIVIKATGITDHFNIKDIAGAVFQNLKEMDEDY